MAEQHVPAMSASGAEVMGRAAGEAGSAPRDWRTFFEVDETAAFVRRHGAARVALQFPDSMLGYAARVAEALEAGTDARCFVLGDTSYGACCVDEVAAEHVGADLIVHYGESCVSPTRRLPVRFCFGRGEVCAPAVVDGLAALGERLEELHGRRVAVFYGLEYAHAAEAVAREAAERLAPDGWDVRVATVRREAAAGGGDDGGGDGDGDGVSLLGFRVRLADGRSMADYALVYVGDPDSRTLSNLALNFNRSAVVTSDPAGGAAREARTQAGRTLGRRFFLTQKVRDAHIIGVVAGTLGVSRYMDAIDHVRALIRNAGKKDYLFVVGKVNDPKLANFSEVDLYVLVACPLNCMVDTARYVKDVVTPYELELALAPGREWTGEYSTDFRSVLPGGALAAGATGTEVEPESEDAANGVRYSLVTGKIVPAVRDASSEPPPAAAGAGAVAVRAGGQVAVRGAPTAASRMAERSFKGLEPRRGQTPAAEVEEGLSGIAKGYASEQK